MQNQQRRVTIMGSKVATRKRPTVSPEERAAKVDALKNKLNSAVESLASSEEWGAYLRFTAGLGTRYSFGNTVLLWAQAQERGMTLSAVASYGSWAKRGRSVLKRPEGHKGPWGLQVFAPLPRRLSEAEAEDFARQGKRAYGPDDKPIKVMRGFKIEHVFDLSQTEGEELPVNPAVPSLLTGEDVTNTLDAFERLIKGHGYSFERGDCGGANGTTSPETKTVRVRADVDNMQASKTALHELAHIRADHVADLDEYRLHRGRMEAEAESVAYVVLGALGADTSSYSVPYVAGWSGGNVETLRAIAELVTKVSHGVLADLESAAE
jgi:hypothetical protein